MANHPKHYCLYLDESGDFEEDPTAPPSLIGGVFGEASKFSRKKARELLKDMMEDPRLKAAGGESLNVYHCAELPAECRVPARLHVINWCAEQGFDFVFFRSNDAIRFRDSTETYLNFLAEGVAQLMAELSYRGSAKLTVCIGRRVDVAARNRDPEAGEQTISEDECRRTIESRITITRAKHLFDTNNQISHEILFDSDKKNEFLVLSDYVCSCRYTLDYTKGSMYEEYRGRAVSGRSMRQELEELFQARGRQFGFLADRLHEDVRRNLSCGHWGSALYLALLRGEPDRKMAEELCIAFQPPRCNSKKQATQMKVFFTLVSDLLSTHGTSQDAAVLLHAYLSFLDTLPIEQSSLRSYCEVNARLYLSTAYGHMAETDKANNELDQCENVLPELLRQPENLELYYILRNRQAVTLQDCFQYDKAIQLLEEALGVAELQQKNQEALIELVAEHENCRPTDQQAKMQGTLASTYQYILPSHPEMAEDAVEAARKAIDAMENPTDKQRHYMTLAEIDLQRDELDEAYQHFCKGLDCSSEDMLKALGDCDNPYNWYHAIRLADSLCRDGPKQTELAQKLFRLLDTRYDSVFTDQYPAHSAARRMGSLCLKLREGKSANKYFDKCKELCFRDGRPTLYAIGLAALAEQILEDTRRGKGAATQLRKRQQEFCKRCEKAEATAQIPELREFFHRLAEESRTCKKNDLKSFYLWVCDQIGH